MELLHLSKDSTLERFRTMFKLRNLVLVCGAGFSRGAPAKNGKVPSGDDLQTLMLNVLEDCVGEDARMLAGLKFPEVAEHFLNPEFVSTDKVKKILADYFTAVSLPADKRDFLKCPWPYIYTFNIDDAIENNSQFRAKILPNRPVSDEAKNVVPCVFKVHGDATDELLYDEPSKIIFSTGSYVRSLTTNKSMLNSIKTDLVESNMLFVGCSLDYEIDLLYALAEYQGEYLDSRLSIYVTSKEPNRFQMAKLKQHGVNAILLVDDFDSFYQVVAQTGRAEQARNDSAVWSSLKTAVINTLDNNRDSNQKFLLQEAKSNNDHSVPFYYGIRDIERQIVRATTKTSIVLLRGRRFSGKTLLLRHVAKSATSKNVYFFSSKDTVSAEMVPAIAKVKNGLFLFDTNSLSPGVAYDLGKAERTFVENGTSLIVAANRTEPEISGALTRYVPDEADFDLDNRFSQTELTLVNKSLDRLGILRFEKGRSLLDNTFRLIREYRTTNSSLLQPRPMSDEESELLLVIAIADKAYTSLATALNIRVNQLFDLCDRFAPIIEYTETTGAELRDAGSRYKVTANTKIGLSYQFAHMISEHGHSWLSARIESIVGKLLELPRFRSIAKSMYMFDSINHVLTQGALGAPKTGFRPVVRKVYENLQPLLNDSSDYWLQRAKAALNVDDDEKSILEGIEFGLKALRETDRSRTVDNAEFSIALLYGKICVNTGFANPSYIVEAVRWFTRAIENYHRNPDYVQRIFDESTHRKSYFSQLCAFLEGSISEPSLLAVQSECRYLLTAKTAWKKKS